MAAQLFVQMLFLLGATALHTTKEVDWIRVAEVHELRKIRSFQGRRGGTSILYEILLDDNATGYASGNILLANISSPSRFGIGEAYTEILEQETRDTWQNFMKSTFKSLVTKALFEEFADYLWNEFAAPHVTQDHILELEGMRNASKGSPGVDVISRRFNTLANLPADPANIVTMLEAELEKKVPPNIADLLNRVINSLDKCTWCDDRFGRAINPSAPGCDSFAVWGKQTVDASLFSSRNLDWQKNTGIAKNKLITVLHTPGGGSQVLFGFASGLGALAGMNRDGITVSEMNLDNSETTFEGPPFPLRLRTVLEKASSLEDAKRYWSETNNTDSMNFLIASGHEMRAFEIEAMRGFSAYFEDENPIEYAATCQVGGKGGGSCGNAFPNATGSEVRIGNPLKNAVWRSNHALHPTIMQTQEPLFNDTVFRYGLIRDLIASASGQIDDRRALKIVAALGIKGRDFFSCDPSQFEDGDNIMSILYAPHKVAPHAYVAFEDSDKNLTNWRPAACNVYVRIDFESLGLWGS
eukprot:g5446.t1